jgi:hypothetical protein
MGGLRAIKCYKTVSTKLEVDQNDISLSLSALKRHGTAELNPIFSLHRLSSLPPLTSSLFLIFLLPNTFISLYDSIIYPSLIFYPPWVLSNNVLNHPLPRYRGLSTTV